MPLIVHWPAGSEDYAAQVKADPVGLVDVAPADLHGFCILLRLLRWKDSGLCWARAREVEFTERGCMLMVRLGGGSLLRSMRVGTFKYIDAPQPGLYDLQADPHELANLYVKGSAKAAELRGLLGKLLARFCCEEGGCTCAGGFAGSLGRCSIRWGAQCLQDTKLRVRGWIRRMACRSFACMQNAATALSSAGSAGDCYAAGCVGEGSEEYFGAAGSGEY